MADDLPHTDHQSPPLECLGLAAGSGRVPPFQLRAGESLCLHVEPPSPYYHDVLVPLLTGRVAHPSLLLRGKVTYLERPMPRRGWFGRSLYRTASDWLTSEKGLTEEEAALILQRLSIAPEVKTGRLPGNERTFLALEAYLLRPSDVLAFDTAGLAPLSIRWVFDRLNAESRSFAKVYLKTNPSPPCYPADACLDVAAQPSELARVE
ncbi:MAG TPA: hypothetical protein VFW33_23060 [Gemmataceae bacterium]|nr:hypothetical protein [Gemmataceae bacterium]